MKPLQDTQDLTGAFATVRDQLSSNGYLCLRGLLPRETVLRLRNQLAHILKDEGWLHRCEAPEFCIPEPGKVCLDPAPEFLQLLERFNRLVEFQALSHHPALIGFFARLFDDDVLVHPRSLPRVIFPSHEEFTTPAHQDYPNIQGTEEVYTAWIPLTDCPASVGGLQVASGSHRAGVFDFHIGNGVGGIEISDPLTGQWHGGPTRAGDVIVFHSMLVHKGIANRSEQVRLSIDARFQSVSEPFNPMNAEGPYGAPADWNGIYETWADTEDARALKFYWDRWSLDEKVFDSQWFDKRDALGFALGEEGDPRARSVLMRVVARDTDPQKRARAQALLDRLPVE